MRARVHTGKVKYMRIGTLSYVIETVCSSAMGAVTRGMTSYVSYSSTVRRGVGWVVIG